MRCRASVAGHLPEEIFGADAMSPAAVWSLTKITRDAPRLPNTCPAQPLAGRKYPNYPDPPTPQDFTLLTLLPAR